MITLKNADCLTVLPFIPDESIDLILTDPPFGCTAAAWDQPLDYSLLWPELLRVAKPRAPIVLFCIHPLTARLVVGQRKCFRFTMVWKKNCPTGHLNANRRPLRQHEDIVVFSKRGLHTYNPQKTPTKPRVTHRRNTTSALYNYARGVTTNNHGLTHPRTVIEIPTLKSDRHLQTPKPLELGRYLVRTFSNAGETVLDFATGSGTFAIAAEVEGRNAVAFEKDPEIYSRALARMQERNIQVNGGRE